MNALVARWRADAEVLRRRGAEIQAVVLEGCAADLEAFERQQALEALTLEQAAAESGFSYSALQRAVASGTVANVGTKGSPRVRRGDLPRKARRRAPEPARDDLVARIRARQ
jgi:hypothetical protein